MNFLKISVLALTSILSFSSVASAVEVKLNLTGVITRSFSDEDFVNSAIIVDIFTPDNLSDYVEYKSRSGVSRYSKVTNTHSSSFGENFCSSYASINRLKIRNLNSFYTVDKYSQSEYDKNHGLYSNYSTQTRIGLFSRKGRKVGECNYYSVINLNEEGKFQPQGSNFRAEINLFKENRVIKDILISISSSST